MDTQCGLKGFEATVGKELFKLSKINAFAIDNEILLLAKEKELKCATIPVSLRSIDGKSVSVVRDGLYMFKDLIILKAKSLFKR